MAIARAKPGAADPQNQIVVVTRAAPRQSTASSFLSPVIGAVRAWADQIFEYTDDGVFVLTPFEADSNDDTAEFNIYYEEYESNSIRGADVSLWTADAPYDPDQSFEISNEYVLCRMEQDTGWNRGQYWSVPVRAQSSYGGYSCDSPQQAEIARGEMRDAIRTGLVAAGGAAIPCIGATVGWAACVGGAFLGAVAASYGYDTANYVWSCRCYFFNWDCEGEPPPI